MANNKNDDVGPVSKFLGVIFLLFIASQILPIILGALIVIIIPLSLLIFVFFLGGNGS